MPKTSKKVFSSNFTTLNCVNKRKVVILLNKTGEKSLQEIANHVRLSESGVRKILKRYRGKNSFEDKPRSGRPVTLSKQTQKKLDNIIETNPHASSQFILDTLVTKTGLKKRPTNRTIVNYRKRLGFFKKSTRKKGILRQENKTKRFNYATKYMNYKWKEYIFIDETDIELYHNPRTGFFKKKSTAYNSWPKIISKN